jgi:hypothetical protein
MALTAEEKLLGALLLSLIAALTFGLYSLHLIDAGKAEEKAAVFAQEQKDEAKAALIEKGWQNQLTTAQTARQGEIDAAKDAALKPYVVSVQRIALRPAVSGGAPAPAASASTAAGGVVCGGVVPGSSGEMRSFERAQAADQLIADYRDLYNSWPKALP